MPNETVEATLRQQDYRVAIEKEIKDWCDSDYKIQEPIRVIGLQVGIINIRLYYYTIAYISASHFALQVFRNQAREPSLFSIC